jgi:hypothetical protein
VERGLRGSGDAKQQKGRDAMQLHGRPLGTR